MAVILQATSGPAAGMKIVVPNGQVAHVGRTRWADHSIPGDATLAEIHFVVDFGAQHCHIRDRSGNLGTLLNGEKIADAQIHSGDQIAAGQSIFSVLVQGEPLPAKATEIDASIPVVKTAHDYARQLDLSPEAVALIEDRQRPVNYLDRLIQGELFADAVRFLAFLLPKPVAVAWGCQCLESVASDRLPPPQMSALRSARQWSAEPNEKNRRIAETAAAAAKYEGPASFLALAAFWSEGSLAPEGLEAVPPNDGLTAQGVMAALLIAASQGDPAQTAGRYRGFLLQGKVLAESQPTA